MKFLCDRCNTRYSIGDERVRGKILKIRCKHCSNVITVREGMGVTENSVVAQLPGVPRVPKATIAPEALDERNVSGLLKVPTLRNDGPATRPLRPTATATASATAS
ncbi:MAG TPA: zinc-ribbon domain-containing protein, partial [Kofleriaceae bacterium]|nr:zinc-ribbon domain-containing protein [Kofleriaceae bacterium]